MLAEERQSLILAQVRDQGFITISDLVRAHQVSEATVRRDLDALAEQGQLRRLRGGAATIKDGVRAENDARTFAEVAADPSFTTKQLIARRAATVVNEGDFIALDSGTTVACMCPFLFDRSITVATASLAVVQALETSATVDLIVIGGILRPSYRSMVGQLAVDTIMQLRFDKAFIGTSGVTDDGTVLDSSPSEVPMKQALMKCARKSLLLADSGKFPGSGLQRVANLPAFSVLVTNQPPAEQLLPPDATTEVLLT